MLTETFVHLPGIGPRIEHRFWIEGIDSWYKAMVSQPPQGISSRRWEELRDLVEESHRCLEMNDFRYFAERLKPGFHWRAWPDFRDRVGYLDIETTGIGHWSEVTVVGVYDGVRVHQFVAGDNLDQLPDLLEQFAIIVTFNGSTFDLPFLRRRFAGLPLDQLHFDLRYGLRRLGEKGGLKAIERRFGLTREEDIEGLSGEDAVRLWAEYQSGKEASLDLLLRYNAADVVNLESLADYAYEKLWQQCQDRAEEARRR